MTLLDIVPQPQADSRRRHTSRRRFPVVLLVMALVVSISLAVTQGTVLYLAHVQPLRLQPAELQKLVALRTTILPRLLSAVSPDDSTIVMMALAESGRGGSEPALPRWAFLNVNDGSSQAINAAANTVEPQTDIAWRDDHTAVYISANRAGSSLLVTLNHDTGSVVSSTLQLPGKPISLAPNASRLLIAIAGSEGTTLAVFDLASGTSEPLITVPGGGGPSNIAWTPDGSKLALVRLTLPSQLAVDHNQLVELATQDALGALSLDQNPFFQGNSVDVFDLVRHDFRPAGLKASGEGYLFNRAIWSTDGQTLLAQMVRPSQIAGRHYPIARYPDRAYLRFYDARLNLLGKLDRPETETVATASTFFVSPDELLIASPDGLSFRLHGYNRASGAFHTLPLPEGSFAEAREGYQVYATHRSRQVIFVHSSFQQPSEVYRIGWDGRGLQALTHFNASAAAVSRMRVDRVTVALHDGGTHDGYLLQPAGAAFPPHNVRLVLFQQGGPGGAMTNRWGATSEEPFDLLPNFGIAVLFMPLAGREGFGPAFYDALFDGRNFGQRDVDEAAQVVEELIRRGYTSHDRIGITGCSYGGYFTAQSITRHPNLYAAANANCSLLDLSHSWEFIAKPDVTFWEGRVPVADPVEYAGDSPRSQAANVHTPLLLVHGNDDQLPLSIVTGFRDQIAAHRIPVELLSFKGEGHGLSNPANIMAAAQAQIRWFQQYLAMGGTR